MLFKIRQKPFIREGRGPRASPPYKTDVKEILTTCHSMCDTGIQNLSKILSTTELVSQSLCTYLPNHKATHPTSKAISTVATLRTSNFAPAAMSHSSIYPKLNGKVVRVHAMKISRDSSCITPLILNISARWTRVVNTTPRQLYPWK